MRDGAFADAEQRSGPLAANLLNVVVKRHKPIIYHGYSSATTTNLPGVVALYYVYRENERMDSKNKEVQPPIWGAPLKAQMRVRQVTNEEMAGHLEVSPGLISHWFKGRREPRLAQYIEMCRYVMADPSAMLSSTALVSNSEIAAGQQKIVDRLNDLEGKLLAARLATSPTHKKWVRKARQSRCSP